MLGPAGVIEEIKSGKDYLNFNLEEVYSYIFSIHCTKTNECPVKILTMGDSEVVFPPSAFIQGAVYHIYIRKMTFDEKKASFIGYRLLKSFKDEEKNK